MSREIVKCAGRLLCPVADGHSVSRRVNLVTTFSGTGDIERSFFRIAWEGHCVEATSREKLRLAVAAISNDNSKQKWWKFITPYLRRETSGTAYPPYQRVLANECMYEAFQPTIGDQRGTRVRYMSEGRYSETSQTALHSKGDEKNYIPDTVATRTEMLDIQRELTRAVKRAERRVERLRKRTAGKAGDEYVGDRK